MESLVQQIQAAYEAFKADAALQVEKGNKAAGTRARKASLELEKLMKEFRKTSLEHSKSNRQQCRIEKAAPLRRCFFSYIIYRE